ncbi:MAG: Hsp20/alpha crystallin family protein [Desulfobacca sp.]|uniref:Hsp20/alpha crystallin family protein n=1 Tax=Desulfobacca sp. TaxID=2067990 RepID=UPI00404909B2
MDIMEWKPFREITRLRSEMDRLWDDYFGSGRKGLRPTEGTWLPSVDVSETADKVVVKAEVPGMDAKDIDISLSGDLLTIKGEKKTEREEKEENYHLVERSYGSFSRSLRLPVAVDADKIEATYKQGVLTITCPKKEEAKAKLIEIKAE